jgi:hypothetical protein
VWTRPAAVFPGGIMQHRNVLGLAALLALAACNPFHRNPVTEVKRDANLNSRWHASLVSPAALAGAVQITGSASMQPGTNGMGTHMSINVANATPGGVHPWQVRRGQCGADDGIFSIGAGYKPLKIGDDGRGESGMTGPESMPTTGNYFVNVYASAANSETVVACGNLASPAR